jgi:hypothetical protein
MRYRASVWAGSYTSGANSSFTARHGPTSPAACLAISSGTPNGRASNPVFRATSPARRSPADLVTFSVFTPSAPWAWARTACSVSAAHGRMVGRPGAPRYPRFCRQLGTVRSWWQA